jgi:hypothetical protein
MSASTPALADVLDRENFDAIAYLNEAFPTEQSLTLVDAATGAFLRIFNVALQTSNLNLCVCVFFFASWQV